jgi:UDP-glucose 4-epimerase
VTGGAGFIGSNLVRLLISSPEGIEVTVIDDFSTGDRRNVEDTEVRVVEGSILDSTLLTKLAHDAESIIHLAARPSVPRSIENPRLSHEVNVTGSLNVLEAARTHGCHVIVASSSSVYGANPHLPKTESMAARPMSPYAANKLAAESYTIAWGSSFGLDTLAFRFFNVYGPGQKPGHVYAAVIPAFIDAAIRRQPLVVHGDGTQTRDFTYVETVCDVIADALERRVAHETPVNLALGSRTSLNEVILRIQEISGTSLEVFYTDLRAGDVPHSKADPNLLASLFPHTQAVSFDVGLQKTYEWILGNYSNG